MNTKFIKASSNGGKIIKCRKDIVLTLANESNITQVLNPSNETLFENGWELYVEEIEEPKPEANEINIENTKKKILDSILDYDSSNKVNIFYVNNESFWLDKQTRSSLKFRLEIEQQLGYRKTTLWYNGNPFEFLIDDAVRMLYLLEKYASECYDNTQRHIYNINKITSIEELNNYDFTVGYPEQLSFNFSNKYKDK